MGVIDLYIFIDCGPQQATSSTQKKKKKKNSYFNSTRSEEIISVCFKWHFWKGECECPFGASIQREQQHAQDVDSCNALNRSNRNIF